MSDDFGSVSFRGSFSGPFAGSYGDGRTGGGEPVYNIVIQSGVNTAGSLQGYRDIESIETIGSLISKEPNVPFDGFWWGSGNTTILMSLEGMDFGPEIDVTVEGAGTVTMVWQAANVRYTTTNAEFNLALRALHAAGNPISIYVPAALPITPNHTMGVGWQIVNGNVGFQVGTQTYGSLDPQGDILRCDLMDNNGSKNDMRVWFTASTGFGPDNYVLVNWTDFPDDPLRIIRCDWETGNNFRSERFPSNGEHEDIKEWLWTLAPADPGNVPPENFIGVAIYAYDSDDNQVYPPLTPPQVPPVIDVQPSDLTVTEPDGGQFTCVMTHPTEPVNYWWQANPNGAVPDGWGDPIDMFSDVAPGSSLTDTLILNSTTASEDGYAVRCNGNAYGDDAFRVISLSAVLTVEAAIPDAVFHEDFNYADGDLETVSGGLWETTFNSGGLVTSNAYDPNHPDDNSTGNDHSTSFEIPSNNFEVEFQARTDHATSGTFAIDISLRSIQYGAPRMYISVQAFGAIGLYITNTSNGIVMAATAEVPLNAGDIIRGTKIGNEISIYVNDALIDSDSNPLLEDPEYDWTTAFAAISHTRVLNPPEGSLIEYLTVREL